MTCWLLSTPTNAGPDFRQPEDGLGGSSCSLSQECFSEESSMRLRSGL